MERPSSTIFYPKTAPIRHSRHLLSRVPGAYHTEYVVPGAYRTEYVAGPKCGSLQLSVNNAPFGLSLSVNNKPLGFPLEMKE